MKNKLFTIATFIGLLYACSPKIAQLPPPPPVAPIAELPSEKTKDGKTLYLNNCTNCHGLYKGSDFSPEAWKPILLKMQKQAQISDEERELIYAYLITQE